MDNSTRIAVDLAINILKTRRNRDKQFGSRLFADPAWDMLLDLFVAHHTRRELSVSSLCVGSGVPQTTALRWIKTLESEGLVIRTADTADARRVLLGLSAGTVALMEDILRKAAQDLAQLFSTSIVDER